VAAVAVGRLNDIVTEYDQLSAELREICARDEQRRGEWIAGGRIGPDPGHGHDRQLVAGKLAGVTEELASARRVLPDKEALHRDAISRLQAAQTERSAAVAAVAVEACEELGTELTAAIDRSLIIEARLLGLRNALLARSNAGDADAGHAAERVTLVIASAKRAAGVPRDTASGPAPARGAADGPGGTMIGMMMCSVPSVATADQLSLLRALARLLDPERVPSSRGSPQTCRARTLRMRSKACSSSSP
jgi:hypothetical protein